VISISIGGFGMPIQALDSSSGGATLLAILEPTIVWSIH